MWSRVHHATRQFFAVCAATLFLQPGAPSASAPDSSQARIAAPDTPFSTLDSPTQFERLGIQYGLSHNSVLAIMQDAAGFLWFGTQDGLNRFDGHSVRVFRHDRSSPRSLPSNHVAALVEDSAGELWVGTSRGLARVARDRLSINRFVLGGPGDAATDPWVTSLAETADGTLWIGTDQGLFGLDRARQAATAIREGESDQMALVSGRVQSLGVDPRGALWVLTGGSDGVATLHRRVGRGFERTRVNRTSEFHIDSSGGIWVDTGGPTGGTEPSRAGALPATSFLEDRERRLWVGTHEGLFIVPAAGHPARRVPMSAPGETTLADEVNAIFQDRAGAVWIGTYGGVLRYDPHRKPFRHYAHRPGDATSLVPAAVSAVHIADDGRYWVGTYGGGLEEINRADGRVTHHRHEPGRASSLCGDYIWDLAPASDGTLWISTRSGICRLVEGDRFERHPLPAGVSYVPVLRQGAGDVLWLGTAGALYEVKADGRAQLASGKSEGMLPDVWSMYVDPNGTVWVGGAGAGSAGGDLVRHVEGAGTTVFSDVADEGIWDIHADAQGILWLATVSGLVRFDPASGHHADAPTSGEPEPVYYSVRPDAEGRLWIGSSKGLVRYDPRGPDRPSKRYDLGDGIGSIEFNRHAAAVGADGELAFGGMAGLTVFRPPEIRDNPYIPPVAITSIQILSNTAERRVSPIGLDALVLSPRDHTVSFDFAALNFTRSERNPHQHRLDAFDRSWIDAGTRTARYTNLPPGRYVFRVRGANNDGLWNPQEVAMAVTVLPAYWQTLWFRLGVAGVVLWGLVAAYRARIRRLLELERLRRRIASDLHDELGSRLSGIGLAISMLARRQELGDRDRQRLTEAGAAARRVVEDLRDIVWYINPEHDSLRSMERRMRAVAATLLEGLEYEFLAQDAGMPVSISMEQRRNVFLIYKELLHNVVRHARARRVEIRLDVRTDGLQLEVTDDGVGIAGESADGTGLKSLRRRAAELGASLTIDRRTDGGTRAVLSLTIPGGVAKADSGDRPEQE